MSHEAPPTDLDWVQLHKEMSAVQQGETAREKFQRKVAENPFVPLGCLATTAALGFGLWNFRQGRKKMSQQMMRLRIVAQGFTVAALVAGVIMTSNKDSAK